MNKFQLSSLAIVACIGFSAFSAFGKDDLMEQIKKDHGNMSAVVDQFKRDKKVCDDDKEKMTFSISKYSSEKDKTQWSNDVVKAFTACQDKYVVNTEHKGSKTQYIYCYDGNSAKLLAPTLSSDEKKKNCAQGK